MFYTGYIPEKDFYTSKIDLNSLSKFYNTRYHIFDYSLHKAIDIQKKLFHNSYSYFNTNLSELVSIKSNIDNNTIEANLRTYLSLDYYYCKIRPKKRKFSSLFHKSNSEYKKFQKYLNLRLISNYENLLVELLLWRLMMVTVQDKKKIEQQIINPILNELKKNSSIIDPKILDIKLNNYSPESWKLNHFNKHWNLLKYQLDRKNPWPIRVLKINSFDCISIPYIAYGYEEFNSHIGLLVQNPSTEKSLKILVLKHNNKSDTHLNESYEFAEGIIFEDYTTVKPHLDFWNYILFITRLNWVLWWLNKLSMSLFSRYKTQPKETIKCDFIF